MSFDGGGGGERIWVTPKNDAESVEIAKLLIERGERRVCRTSQRWGASWAGLEPEILAELERFVSPSSGAAAGTIYGIELAGPHPYGARAVNIDHHRYGGGDDRSHPLSSLEQVAAMLGGGATPLPLTRWQTLVALNDRGYIPAMTGGEAPATAEEVAAVRRADRAAQGITEAQEAAAARDVAERAEWSGGGPGEGDRVKVWCPEGSTSAHSDALYGRARMILLMSPGEWNYYGPGHRDLAAIFDGAATEFSVGSTWCGGAKEGGYFGIAAPGVEAQRRILAWFERSLTLLHHQR